MIEYDPAELTDKPEGEYEVGPLSERIMSVLAYSAALAFLLRELQRETKLGVIGAYKVGGVDESIFTGLKTSGDDLVKITKPKVEKIFQDESVSHTKRFIQKLKKALGIDVSLLVRETDNHSLLRTYVQKNTSLITSLKNDIIKQIEQEVYNAKINNDSATKLSKALQKKFGLMKNRADLIARDQLSKLNADFNKARQVQAGQREYEWDYQHGIPRKNRRNHHVIRHKRTYKWGEPLGDEPGHAIDCKCRAKMKIKVKKRAA